MMEDTQLLRSYVDDRSETAFAELVRRHLDFVYATALRTANGDAHLAQDATQQVFSDLARKAGTLSHRQVLAGWLHTSARFAVSRLIRGEQRRKAREQAAQLMDLTHDDATAAADWDRLRPVLDGALAELSDTDREAVLLRFFQGLGFGVIGTRLHLSENAARMRVDRALDKLAGVLAKRGLTSSTVALASVLASQPAVAAPAGLSAVITGTALAGASTAGVITVVANFMSMNKLAMGIAGAIAVTGASGLVVQSRTASALRAEVQQLKLENQEVASLQSVNSQLAKVAAEVEAMKADDTALAQLGEEANALKGRMHVAEQRIAQAKAAQTIYDRKSLDRAPRALTQVPPEYPAAMRNAGTEGEVVVDFVVDAKGRVQNAFAVSSTVREFEAPAVDAVSQWTFEPGQHGGRAVNTHLQVKVGFTVAQGSVAQSAVPVPATK